MTTEELNAGTAAGAAGTAAPDAAPIPTGPKGGPKKKKKKPNKVLRRIIVTFIILAVIVAIGLAIWFFLFRTKEEVGDIMPATAQIGSIQSSVQGSGDARAGASAAITLPAAGTIEEVLVNVDDTVFEGQPLFTAFSPEAQDQVTAAEKAISDQKAVIEQRKKSVADAQKQAEKARSDLSEIRGKISELTTTAPFAGKLTDVADWKVGQELAAGTHIATLVNDRRMSLTLYFSYAYEDDIYVGQAVDVSIPALMITLPGQVEGIHKVNFISPEGGVFFEVDIGLDNPETLTEKMAASAVMKTVTGFDIYPYDNGELKYSDTQEITTRQPGKVKSIGSLRNYANVSSGEQLLVQSTEALDELIAAAVDTVDMADQGVSSAQQSVADAEARLTELEEALTKAQNNLSNLNAVAPISGKITSCTIAAGSEVAGGTTVITISDTTNMTVEITVDDRNIPFVTPGMTVELTDWNGMTYFGTVTNIDMSASESGSMGMTNYPVTLSVENYDGSLLQGMWLDYSFVTSSSENCVIVPIQCVKSIVDTEGNPQTVVFIQSEDRPDNAVDFEMPDETYGTPQYPSSDEGYWPVPVETGLSDRYNVEIVSGLSEGDTVFSAYMMTGAYG